MPTMPTLLPQVDPVIPEGYKFLAVTLRAPTPLCPSGFAIMHWPTLRRDSPDGPLYEYPITPENVALRLALEGLDAVSWREIKYEDLPKDRAYRDALADDGTKVHHDMTKAREIHRQHLRIARIQALADLDVAYQRADEKGDKEEKARIASRKQELRDITAHPGIEAAQSVEELKQVWHEALK